METVPTSAQGQSKQSASSYEPTQKENGVTLSEIKHPSVRQEGQAHYRIYTKRQSLKEQHLSGRQKTHRSREATR